ncbi:MAG: chromate efflux transporter, partial [Acidimicrobiales bacterium]
GLGFIGPAMAIVLGLAWAYVRYRSTPTGGGLLYGVEPVVVAVVAVALWELARTAFHPRWYVILGVASLAGYFGGVNVLILLVGAGVIASMVENRGQLRPVAIPGLLGFPIRMPSRVHHPGLLSVAGEFAKLGAVVFGSGYVLLAFLRGDLVGTLHWLSLRQVLDAVAAGQVTPGPVFTTATFLGYLIGGLPAALVATAAIFFPSFVMVTVLEPLVGRIRRSRWARPALSGISAAALGLMAGVTIDLGRAAVTDPLTIGLALTAAAVLLRWRPNAFWLVAGGAAVGVVHALV